MTSRKSTLGHIVQKLSSVAGWDAYHQGRLELALGLVTAAIELDANSGQALELRGLVLRDMADPLAAVDALERASLLIAISPLSRICMAECYAVLKRRNLARDLYMLQAELLTNEIDLLLLCAAGLEGIDEPRLAMDICRRAGAIDPSSGQVVYDMCFYAARCGSQFSLVEELAWRAVELAPDNVHFRVGLASLLIRLKNASKAAWVVRSLTQQQIAEVTCKCCLERIEQLYIESSDSDRAAWCRDQLWRSNDGNGGSQSPYRKNNQTSKEQP